MRRLEWEQSVWALADCSLIHACAAGPLCNLSFAPGVHKSDVPPIFGSTCQKVQRNFHPSIPAKAVLAFSELEEGGSKGEHKKVCALDVQVLGEPVEPESQAIPDRQADTCASRETVSHQDRFDKQTQHEEAPPRQSWSDKKVLQEVLVESCCGFVRSRFTQTNMQLPENVRTKKVPENH
eukprot:4828833-Amphidinium_carterae.2